MKPAPHYFLCLIIAGSIGISSCSVSSHAEKANGVNLSNYKTFGWTTSERKSKASSEIIDNNIKAIVTEEMEKKGLAQVSTKPDLILDYSVTLPRGERQRRPAYGRMGSRVLMGAGGRGGVFLQPGVFVGNRYRNTSAEGTLTINMLDANTNKLVWQGWANDYINSRTITTKQAKSNVKAILKKFDNQ